MKNAATGSERWSMTVTCSNRFRPRRLKREMEGGGKERVSVCERDRERVSE